MDKKICVYSCITGNYDNIIDYKTKDKNIDYILFTNDSSIKSDFWNIVYIDNDSLDNIRLARKIKILGHPILDNYDVTVWIDGASYPKKNINEFIKKYCDLKKYDIIGFKHPTNDCIYDEAKSCIIHDKDKKSTIIKQIEFLKNKNYPEHNGLIESAILVRNNKSVILKETMKIWFDMVKKYSYRDQLSFNYAIYSTGINVLLLNMKAFDNDFFGRMPHITKERLRKFRIYFGNYKNLDEYDYNLDFINDYKKKDNKFIIKYKPVISNDSLIIRLDDIGGIRINNISIKNIENPKVYYIDEIKFYHEHIFIKDDPTIIINGKYNKDENIIIELDMILLKENNYKDTILYILKDNKILYDEKEKYMKEKIELEKKNKEYSNIIKDLDNNYQNLINSRSWKITKPIRKVKSILNKITKRSKK